MTIAIAEEKKTIVWNKIDKLKKQIIKKYLS